MKFSGVIPIIALLFFIAFVPSCIKAAKLNLRSSKKGSALQETDGDGASAKSSEGPFQDSGGDKAPSKDPDKVIDVTSDPLRSTHGFSSGKAKVEFKTNSQATERTAKISDEHVASPPYKPHASAIEEGDDAKKDMDSAVRLVTNAYSDEGDRMLKSSKKKACNKKCRKKPKKKRKACVKSCLINHQCISSSRCAGEKGKAKKRCATTCVNCITKCNKGSKKKKAQKRCWKTSKCLVPEAKPTPKPTENPTPSPTHHPTPSPTKSPTKNPTKSPTDSPSSKITEIPSSFPSSPPSSSPTTDDDELEGFKGILSAFSVNKGIINVTWDESFLGDDVSYDLFVALGEYDFNANASLVAVPDLIDTFEDEPSFQHIELTEKSEITVATSFLGEPHTLLVTAQKDGKYSKNRKTTQVVVSTSDPHIRDEVNVVGIFFPTSRVEITLSENEEAEQSLTFTGPVAPEAQKLVTGDYVTGFTTNFKPFICKIVSIIQSGPNGVNMIVFKARIEDVFDELDLDGNFDVSRKQTGVSGRRLFWGDVGNFFKDVGKGIGDAVTGAIDNVGNFVKETFGGEKLEEFKIIDIDVPWEYTLLSHESESGASASLAFSGAVDFEVSLFAKIRVAGAVPIFAHVGAKASYGLEANLGFSAGWEKTYEKNYEVWSGRRMTRFFFVGPVPVEVYGQPKLEVNVNAKASLSLTSQIGVSVTGDTEAGIIYDAGHNPVLRDSFKPPSFDFDYTLPTIEGEAAVEAGAAIVLSLDAGIYGGILEGNVGLSGGIGLEAAAGVVAIGITDGSNPTVLPTINKFGMDLIFSIPFSASALYGQFDIIETTIYEKKWPIIGLPSVEVGVLDDHRCLLGDNNGGSVASLSLKVDQENPTNALISNELTGSGSWYLNDSINGWAVRQKEDSEIVLEKTGLTTFSPEPEGTVTFAIKPRIPPLPLYVVKSVSLQTLFSPDGAECSEAGPCDGDPFFDKLTQDVGAEFNSRVFLSQPPDPSAPLFPSTVYKFEDFMAALKKLQSAGEKFQFWLGDDCSEDSRKAALVNMATFLGQAMRETIIYDACDENNWDLWHADVFKEPTSPSQNLPALYPMSSGCGQLGQKYAEYHCEDECPLDPNMELTATTNAQWIGAPPPLICGPRSKYDGLGYWNPQQFCKGEDGSCEGEPFYYPGQTAGVHVPVNEDPRFPDTFYTNPLPNANGVTPAPRTPDSFPPTNVENCCWWGRGVIQTTGRCNFGKLNKQIGAGAGANGIYPNINFCQNPQAICDGPSDLKWIAGIFFWVSDAQVYDQDGFNYINGVKEYVSMGCADDPDKDGCDFLFEYASGIVNRGCHDPGETGCPGCVPGATCDPAHNIPERVAASKQALRALMGIEGGGSTGGSGGTGGTGGSGTCGNGSRGDGVCSDGTCCSEHGWCGTSEAHCAGSGPSPSPPPPTPSPPTGTGGGGSCGNGSRGDGVCSDGTCCSEHGWCGTSAEHCSGNGPSPSPPPPTPSPPTGTGGGGSCGNGSRGDGVCSDGTCCSEFGWCGTSEQHCS